MRDKIEKAKTHISKMTTKQKIKSVIIGLMIIIFLIGLITAFNDRRSNFNTPQSIAPVSDIWASGGGNASLNKKGKWTTTVSAATITNDQSELWEHSRTVEIISWKELQQRIIKNRKIQEARAKKAMNENAGDSVALTAAYNNAVISRKLAETTLSQRMAQANSAGFATFFGIYAPVLLILGILLIVNHNAVYKQKEEQTEEN